MWVVKIGGSVLKNGEGIIEALIRTLARASRIEPLLVLAGGGSYADIIRDVDRRYRVGEAAHWMAILGMHMNAYRLAAGRPEVFHLTEHPDASGKRLLQILLPYELLQRSRLPTTWDVTSDSIAAYVASLLHARLALLKPVDGLFHPFPGGGLVPAIKATKLSRLPSSPVDSYLPKIISRHALDSWLVNGFHPDRLEDLMKKQRTIGTHIYT